MTDLSPTLPEEETFLVGIQVPPGHPDGMTGVFLEPAVHPSEIADAAIGAVIPFRVHAKEYRKIVTEEPAAASRLVVPTVGLP